jgi:hypothetical protein
MTWIRLVTILLVVTALAGCAASPDSPLASPYFELEPGSVLELHRDLEIPPGMARIFFQRGKVIGKGGMNQYEPSCDIEVRDLSQEIQFIRKGIFFIEREQFGREAVAEAGGLKLAFSGGLWRGGGFSVFRFRRLWLQSEEQPQVMRMTCRGTWEEIVRAKPPTLPEIRIALGEIFSIKPDKEVP